MPRNAAPALGERLGVAVSAPRANLMAAGDRVPCRLRPLDPSRLRHAAPFDARCADPPRPGAPDGASAPRADDVKSGSTAALNGWTGASVVPIATFNPAEMHLVGQLSNPSGPLEAVFEALSGEPIGPTGRSESLPAPGRLGNGVIQRAVVKVLAAADRPMRGADIHRAVEHALGHLVSKNSVSWCLAACVRGRQPRFERVGYGVYRLKRG